MWEKDGIGFVRMRNYAISAQAVVVFPSVAIAMEGPDPTVNALAHQLVSHGGALDVARGFTPSVTRVVPAPTYDPRLHPSPELAASNVIGS
jgi:hypothetical protein